MSTSVFSSKFAAGLLAAGAVALSAPVAVSGEYSSATVVRPLAGLSFDVGAKHAVGYFEQKNGGCDLTLLVGSQTAEAAEGARGTVPVRFKTPVSAGRSARIDTGEGPSVEFFCSSGAAWLSARVMERVAHSTAAAR